VNLDMGRSAMICKTKLRMLVAVVGLAAMLMLFLGCSRAASHTQTINIVAEPVNVVGLHAKVEYYLDAELVNSMHFIDGNGDSVIDGKSGPKEKGSWPEGWEWFNDLYGDVVVGHSTITMEGERIKFQDGVVYELIAGNYEC
jgi:hypothetical protein